MADTGQGCRKKKDRNIRVKIPDCTGCLACYRVCPFEAVAIQPRTDGQDYPHQVGISRAACAYCGFCEAVCPTQAIEMAGFSRRALEREALAALQGAGGNAPALAFVCERCIDIRLLAPADGAPMYGLPEVAVKSIPCAGVLEKRTLDAVLSAGVEAVFIVRCFELDCHYREGRRRVKGGFQMDEGEFLPERQDPGRVRILETSFFDPRRVKESMQRQLKERED